MARRIQEYATDDIVVTFDPNLCVHVANCLRMLPGVFDVGRRKWIDPSAATPDEIAETIRRCPSGALQYRRLDGGPEEEPDRPTTVRTVRNGPLVARGEIHVTASDGTVLAEGTRFTFCRCGQSQNKPFCDTSHRRVAFEAD